MKIEIIGKNVSITNAMHEYIENKLGKLERYIVLDDSTRARVLVRTYDTHHKVEVTIPAKWGVLRAEAKAEDMYAAVDKVVDRLKDQVRRQKTRLEKRHRDSITDVLAAEQAIEENKPVPVRTKTVEIRALDYEEAVMAMELSGHDFYAYVDVDTDDVSILYRREDGGYGVLATKRI